MNIKLVPSTSKHAEIAFKWRKQKSTLNHNPLKNMTLQELAEHFSKNGSDLSDISSHADYRWMAVMNNSVVGNVSLKNINQMMMCAEIGYGVDEDFQGKGYGTEIVRLLVDRVFEQTPIRKLIAYVHDKNTPSCRLLEKLGFQKEGLLREHYIINGKPENEVLYGLLRSDWQGVR